MELRILGAHQGESDRFGFFSLMVTESLALDAGSLSSGLSWEAQASVRSVLITHAHFDHMKDLNTLGFNHFNRGLSLDVYCLPVVQAAIRASLFHRDTWLDLSARPAERPAICFHDVEPHRPFSLEGFTVTPIPSIHTVPTTGYLISKDGRSFYYTGDTGPGNVDQWVKANPDLLITEVTFGNSLNDLAGEVHHLTPSLLSRELQAFQKQAGHMPKVLVVHVNPVYEAEVAREIGEVARDLNADILLACEGMIVTV